MVQQKTPLELACEYGRLGWEPHGIIDPIAALRGLKRTPLQDIIQLGDNSKTYRNKYVGGILEFMERCGINQEEHQGGLFWLLCGWGAQDYLSGMRFKPIGNLMNPSAMALADLTITLPTYSL